MESNLASHTLDGDALRVRDLSWRGLFEPIRTAHRLVDAGGGGGSPRPLGVVQGLWGFSKAFGRSSPRLLGIPPMHLRVAQPFWLWEFKRPRKWPGNSWPISGSPKLPKGSGSSQRHSASESSFLWFRIIRVRAQGNWPWCYPETLKVPWVRWEH